MTSAGHKRWDEKRTGFILRCIVIYTLFRLFGSECFIRKEEWERGRVR